MADFTIKEDGVIVRNNINVPERDTSAEQELYAEYNRLVYEVVGHPDRFSPAELEIKKQRMKEIEKSGVRLNDNKAIKLKMAKLKTDAKISVNNSVFWESVAKFKKEND